MNAVRQQSFSLSILANASPQAAFKSINQVTDWWTKDLLGKSQNLNDTFSVHFGDVHVSTQKIIELVPNQKVVWLVTESSINFVGNKQEWKDTQIIFDISKKSDQTEIRFTHAGLQPDLECFSACSKAWNGYITGSLLSLITTGKGKPGGTI